MRDTLRAAWLVAGKDVLIELRTREILYTTAFFATACVLVFAFSFVQDGRAPEIAAPGIVWIAIAFAGTLALGRSFERERYGDTLSALLLGPSARSSIYLGKLFAIICLMLGVEAVVVPLVVLLFNSPLFARPGFLVLLLCAGTVGFAAVGTLFAAMLVRARSRDILLPILLYPITVPVIIAGVRGMAALMDTESDPALLRFWLAVLAAFDAVFLTLALWVFEPVMRD